MKYVPCLLYGINDRQGEVHLTHMFLLDGEVVVGRVTYCGLTFDREAAEIMPYHVMRFRSCRFCVDVAFPASAA